MSLESHMVDSSAKPRVNLTNVTRGIDMVKYEIHQQDRRIKELESILVLKNQEIVSLRSELSELNRKYLLVFSSLSNLNSSSLPPQTPPPPSSLSSTISRSLNYF